MDLETIATYGTAQMQLHTLAHVLAYLHACANMCPITSDGTLVGLNLLHMRVTQRAAHACYTKGCTHTYAARVDTYIGTYTYDTGVSPTCSRQSLKSIVSQGAYSSDIISGYSE